MSGNQISAFTWLTFTLSLSSRTGTDDVLGMKFAIKGSGIQMAKHLFHSFSKKWHHLAKTPRSL